MRSGRTANVSGAQRKTAAVDRGPGLVHHPGLNPRMNLDADDSIHAIPAAALHRTTRRPVTRRAPRLFRIAALLAALGMLLGWAEAAMPDVHDGHGTAEPEAAWVQLSHGHVPAPAEAPGHEPQAPHTCHCIHAHAPALHAAGTVSPRADARALAFFLTRRALASVAPEPHFRPPVA
jgi:hypothetical protein